MLFYLNNVVLPFFSLIDSKKTKTPNSIMYTLEGEWYVCSKCPYSIRSEHFKKHIQAHSWKTTYTCQTCHLICRTLYKYERHLLIHTDERPFVCSVCQKAFRQNNSLLSHLLVHLRKQAKQDTKSSGKSKISQGKEKQSEKSRNSSKKVGKSKSTKSKK